MSEISRILIVVCPLVFLAGFVDSIAGGGGLITLPAYLMVGLPTHVAAGTNKVVASFGTMVSSASYIKSGKVLFRIAIPTALCALAGSAIATRLATGIPDATLKILLLLALPAVAVFLAVKKDFGKDGDRPQKEMSRRRELLTACAIGGVMGLYDGFIGPGTGTFLMMLITAFLGLDLLISSGCAKIANLASNVASAAVWAVSGNVMWRIVVPAAICNMLGNYCGARFAIKGGSKRVRGMIFVVLALLFIKVGIDLVSK